MIEILLTGVGIYYLALSSTLRYVTPLNLISTCAVMLGFRYARCTRSVSNVPPAYYAHLAAFRARFYMEPETSDSGSMISGAAAGRGGGPGGAGSSTSRSTCAAAASAAVRELPSLKENVKRVMLYY